MKRASANGRTDSSLGSLLTNTGRITYDGGMEEDKEEQIHNSESIIHDKHKGLEILVEFMKLSSQSVILLFEGSQVVLDNRLYPFINLNECMNKTIINM